MVVVLTVVKDDSQAATKQIHLVVKKTIQFVHDIMRLWGQKARKWTYQTMSRINLCHGIASVVKYCVRPLPFTSSSYDRRKMCGMVLQGTGLACINCINTSLRTCINTSLIQQLKHIFFIPLPIFYIVSIFLLAQISQRCHKTSHRGDLNDWKNFKNHYVCYKLWGDIYKENTLIQRSSTPKASVE